MLMPTESTPLPIVLTIAGFDPSGGAGIIADIRTISAFGCTPVAAITSLTFQNSAGVFGAIHQTAESLRSQILPLVKEFRIEAVKVGMLPTRGLVLEVVRLLRETEMPAPVVDPVLNSSSGYELMEPAAREAWLTELMPMARVMTPNIPEAEMLTEMTIANESDMRAAAGKLRDAGAEAVLVKGGHLKERSEIRGQKSAAGPDQAIDILDDQGCVTAIRGEWIDAPPVRGTGCMLSAAIAAGLSLGLELPASVGAAKRFVADAIRYAANQRTDPVALELAEKTMRGQL
jgi:hydroxymethylpyrimidine/phosphomethylpyrimidine kinase